MLSHIFIKNFAIIKEIDIDLGEHMNIISGETGTGKSIVIQAINMALGGRSSSSLVAENAEKSLVQLVFSLNDREKNKLIDLLGELDDEELIISRELNKNGKSLAKVNGEIVNLSRLCEVTSHLIDVHGQYDNQALLKTEQHVRILDGFGGQKVADIKAELAEVFAKYQDARRELAKLKTNHSEYLRKKDFMKYELDEINAAALHAGEDEELESRLKVLQNSEKISDSLNEVYSILRESALEKCKVLMEGVAQYDERYAMILASLGECVYTLNDVTDEVRKLSDEVSFSPEELNSSMIRLDLIDKLKMKYGGTIEEVLAYAERCEKELLESEDISARQKALEAELLALHKVVAEKSEALSIARKEAARRLAGLMSEELKELNFANAEFSVDIEKNLSASGHPAYTEDGCDRVEFLFNANKGGSLKPLAQIASGGEISRICLAFKSIVSDIDDISTMVFDEIDTGISGITASVVGKKMHELGRSHQILCITHLPQIAAAGDHQYLIAKDDTDERSYTTIHRLNDEERVAEIARLLGGTNVTETTLASARELISASH